MPLPGLQYIATNEIKRTSAKNTMNFAGFVGGLGVPGRSMWLTAGLTPAGGPPPDFSTSGFTCNSLTSGNCISGVDFTEPVYLTSFVAANQSTSASQKFNVGLCDRLWAASGFNLNTTGQQDVGTLETLPPRDIYGTSSGFGLEVIADVQVAFNATVGNILINYNDAYGTPKTLTLFRPSNQQWLANQTLFCGGDVQGISGITSARFDSTGAGVGRFSLAVIRRITMSKIDDMYTDRNSNNGPLDTCLPLVYPSSCLFGIDFTNLSATTPMHCGITIGLCQ